MLVQHYEISGDIGAQAHAYFVPVQAPPLKVHTEKPKMEPFWQAGSDHN